ncbi:hypothetical protein ACGFS9_13655 [Streptomyces sp. NPDC048566]|uniref:hypothetical protein n=1 Tax=Streptomyces sp. NPDC048566 TaxID=3365569 RepID=UPI0037170E4D
MCVVTTALGHALMSSVRAPQWWALGLAFGAAMLCGWWLTGRERGVFTVVATTVTTQVLLHLLFHFSHHPGGDAAAGVGASHHGGAGMGGMLLGHAGMTMRHIGAPEGSGMVAEPPAAPFASTLAQAGGAGMFAAHVLAAVVCGLWVWRGEAAVHRLGRALAAVLFAPLHRAFRALLGRPGGGKVPSWRAVADSRDRRWPPPAALQYVIVRRGPPAGGVIRSPLSRAPSFAVRA